MKLDKIPYAHTITILNNKNITEIHPYYSDYCKPAALAKTYEVQMVAMSNKEDWSVSKFVFEEIVLSPRYQRMPGRPRKRREKIQMKR
ncbi:hypothetical protein H5410_036010 [Solanum commersonii]|uniref:Uncharacterized protein n=1 Tax=Solanum commersonii TaxID=4109 RepID=A0A9J5Y468_SOLCO|nr:hypothetical protein H5410_036010 [Solanum commersonii]